MHLYLSACQGDNLWASRAAPWAAGQLAGTAVDARGRGAQCFSHSHPGQRNEPNLDPCLSAVCFVCLCFYKHGTPCVPSLDKGFLSRENQEKREEIRLDCLSYLNTRQSDNSIHCAHIPPTAQTERGGGGRHKSEVYQTINYVCERSGQTLY